MCFTTFIFQRGKPTEDDTVYFSSDIENSMYSESSLSDSVSSASDDSCIDLDRNNYVPTMQTCEDDSEDSESDIIIPSNYKLGEELEKESKKKEEYLIGGSKEDALINFKRAKKPPRIKWCENRSIVNYLFNKYALISSSQIFIPS